MVKATASQTMSISPRSPGFDSRGQTSSIQASSLVGINDSKLTKLGLKPGLRFISICCTRDSEVDNGQTKVKRKTYI